MSENSRPEPAYRGGAKRREGLPPYRELKKLLVEDGLTYAEIGRKYGFERSTVAHRVKVDAIAAGEWPLCLDRVQRIKDSKHLWKGGVGYSTRQSIPALGVLWVLDEWLEEHDDVTPEDLCRQVGIHESYIYNVRHRLKRNVDVRMDRKYARKILKAIDEPHWTTRQSRADAKADREAAEHTAA